MSRSLFLYCCCCVVAADVANLGGAEKAKTIGQLEEEPRESRQLKEPRGAKDTAIMVSGFLLIPLTIWLYSSPFPVARSIVRARSTGEYSFIPYLMLCSNCFSWVVFSFQCGLAEYYACFFPNVYGTFANALVLAVYCRFITDPQVRRSFLIWVPMVTLSLLVLATISFLSGTNNCSNPDSLHCWWGKVTVLCNLALFCGPMAAARRAFTTKSTKYLPLGQSLAALVASSNCCIYFSCLWNLNGLVPNVAGTLLSLAQIVFYMTIIACYGRELVEEPAAETSPSQATSETGIPDPVLQAYATSGSYLLGGSRTSLADSFISGSQSQVRQASMISVRNH